ncbi:PfkB family carbohydrate kinase [methane-oxidizing endosymbiont of Gigantopelta aegis]|uniref:PfkB family carbohydrate kinase n=1 Tax=methane-oxidizing endosymbiont of Gigantopelta aegis TaxID=2794938 RepID=UPI0018DB7211|nr:PfkB family carbohydrate kinase [methane-oxidizing endosymbiont of Gigantopelta aegis]
MNQKTKQIALFGEVLFDQFPDGKQVLGGAPFNVAWHLQAFGVEPLFISRVGKDDNGENILATMQNWDMRIDAVQIDTQHPTGCVQIQLQNGEPSYDIVADSAWDFIDVTALPDLSNIKLFYHGSLVFRQTMSRQCLARILAGDFKRFVDVNLRDPWWCRHRLEQMIESATWLKLNTDEQLQLQKEITGFGGNLIVTAGAAGATFLPQQGEALTVSPTPTMVVDTVGAGDAFSSIVLLGILSDWPMPLTFERAQQFASRVVELQGATTQDRAFYQDFIRQWRL